MRSLRFELWRYILCQKTLQDTRSSICTVGIMKENTTDEGLTVLCDNSAYERHSGNQVTERFLEEIEPTDDDIKELKAFERELTRMLQK